MKINKILFFDIVSFCIATCFLYFFASFVYFSEDFAWYANPDRLNQFGYISFDKSRVALISDQFQSLNIRVLVLSMITAFAQTTFLAVIRANIPYENNSSYSFILGLLLVISNVYLIQLGMHLWRQTVALYFLIAGIFSNKKLSLMFYLLAIFFHEVTLILIVIYYTSGKFLNTKMHKILCSIISLSLFVMSSWIYFLPLIFSFFKLNNIMTKLNKIIFSILIFNFVAFFFTPEPIYKTINQRLTVIAGNMSVIAFLTMIYGRHKFFYGTYGIVSCVIFTFFICYGIIKYV